MLEDYASYVLEREVPDQDEARIKSIIERAFARLVERVPQAQMQRRCVSVGQLLIRVLEAHGVWCFAAQGSVAYEFDPTSKLESRFTYSVDREESPGGFVGHAWLVVPPFHIVDGTAALQSWNERQAALIPPLIMAKDTHVVPPEYEIAVAPAARREVSPSAFFNPSRRDISRRFPARQVVLPRVKITYQADGVGLPDAPLAGIRNLVSDPVALFRDL